MNGYVSTNVFGRFLCPALGDRSYHQSTLCTVCTCTCTMYNINRLRCCSEDRRDEENDICLGRDRQNRHNVEFLYIARYPGLKLLEALHAITPSHLPVLSKE
jgi:hypothetical protein